MIEIIAVSDGHKHFEKAIAEYKKRNSKNVSLETIKPTKKGTSQRIIEKESQDICARLEKKSNTFVIGLDESGDTLDTLSLDELIQEKQNSSYQIIFVIGGAYGYDKKMLDTYIDRYVSLSSFTLPHGLALLVLVEQLYRVMQIRKGSKYHHDSIHFSLK